VDAIRSGAELESTFVAIHEPGGHTGQMPIRRARRLDPPPEAGADAVALRIESEWGVLWVFSSFAEEVEIDGIRFQGDFGIVCRAANTDCWFMAVGSPTLRFAEAGFSDQPSHWRGEVAENTPTTITSASPRPQGWPTHPEWCGSYVRLHDGKHETGFPVEATTGETIMVRRFPLPKVSAFELPAVRYLSVTQRP